MFFSSFQSFTLRVFARRTRAYDHNRFPESDTAPAATCRTGHRSDRPYAPSPSPEMIYFPLPEKLESRRDQESATASASSTTAMGLARNMPNDPLGHLEGLAQRPLHQRTQDEGQHDGGQGKIELPQEVADDSEQDHDQLRRRCCC